MHPSSGRAITPVLTCNYCPDEMQTGFSRWKVRLAFLYLGLIGFNLHEHNYRPRFASGKVGKVMEMSGIKKGFVNHRHR